MLRAIILHVCLSALCIREIERNYVRCEMSPIVKLCTIADDAVGKLSTRKWAVFLQFYPLQWYTLPFILFRNLRTFANGVFGKCNVTWTWRQIRQISSVTHRMSPSFLLPHSSIRTFDRLLTCCSTFIHTHTQTHIHTLPHQKAQHQYTKRCCAHCTVIMYANFDQFGISLNVSDSVVLSLVVQLCDQWQHHRSEKH